MGAKMSELCKKNDICVVCVYFHNSIRVKFIYPKHSIRVYVSITYCKQKAGTGREERVKVEEEEESCKALSERDDTQLIGEYERTKPWFKKSEMHGDLPSNFEKV